MAWYRCGGGGVPASVKTDMNAVLNKKFGTSTDYPPADWAPTVNLMGPLPEKTQASAPVCSFDDGADDVPTKSLVVTIPPTLDGVSLINEKQTGRNILDFTVRSQYGITTTKGADGGAIISGTASGGNVFVIDFVAMDLEAGKYNILVSGMQTGMTASWTKNGSYGGALNEGANVITLSAKTKIGGYVRVTNGSSYPDPVTVYVQLTIGQDSEPFEKYSPTQYTADLGRTIYGGQADIVNGEGTEMPTGTVLFSDLTWNYNESLQVFYAYVTGKVSGRANFATTSFKTVDKAYQQLSDMEITGTFSTDSINAKDTTVSTVSDFLTKYGSDTIRYQNATPTDFTFTGQEIPTRLGVNNFWSDSGDTEVTYRADIDLLLGGN